ncbi:hypothetical protein Emag_003470 [Eimeria magna]
MARLSARVREVRGWSEIPEYEPVIQPDRNPAFGGLLAAGAPHHEEDSCEVIEARPPLPTPASNGVSAELEGSAELSPSPGPRAPGSGRAAPQTAPTSPAAPPPRGRPAQGPLGPLRPATTVAFNALGTLAVQGCDYMATLCVWWTLAAGQEYRAASESFEHCLQELQWVDSLSRTIAAHAMLTSSSHGQSSAPSQVDQPRQEQLGGPAVTEDQVERLILFWLSSAERLATLVGPGRTSPREFRNGLYRAEQALLGMTVASTVPPRPVDAPAAPHEPSASAPSAGMGHFSALPSTPEETTPPPPLPDLGTEEFRLPQSSVTERIPPQHLGVDELLNGLVGRCSADDASVAPVAQQTGSTAELSKIKQPASRRTRTPGKRRGSAPLKHVEQSRLSERVCACVFGSLSVLRVSVWVWAAPGWSTYG